MPLPFLKIIGDFLQRGGWLDRWLLLAVALGVILGAQGFGWGRYDCLNLDRMALRNVDAKNLPYLHPGKFAKPPFYTYMNHFLARLPSEFISRNLFWLGSTERRQAGLRIRLALARTLNLALFAGCVVLMFGLARDAYGLASGRMAALLLATSAGFVPYQVFLTTDLAVVFMMLAAFACAVRIVKHPGMGISIAAGLLTGLAAATKYNGLIVAAALPVAHLLASRGNPVIACLKRPAAWVCGLCVPLGFLLGNPYALFDWPTFWSDFLYNYKVTPVYTGVTEGTGYAAFFKDFVEIFGWPGTWLIVAGGLAALPFIIRRRENLAWHVWVLSAIVFAAYAWKIGSFPRMETRFVLPSAPYALLMGAAGFGVLLRARFVVLPVFAAILIYNLASGWVFGDVFRHDPRMEALDLAARELDRQSVVEASPSMPRIKDLPNRPDKLIRIPNGLGISQGLIERFADDEQMGEAMEKWGAGAGVEWFTPEARAARGTEWIFWSSIDLETLVQPSYDALFRPESGFEVVFDRTSPDFPSWGYPHNTLFLRNRVTVWKKRGAP